MKNCKWKECPIKLGFEIFFQAEDDEKWARKKILPLILKLFKLGTNIENHFKKQVNA